MGTGRCKPWANRQRRKGLNQVGVGVSAPHAPSTEEVKLLGQEEQSHRSSRDSSSDLEKAEQQRLHSSTAATVKAHSVCLMKKVVADTDTPGINRAGHQAHTKHTAITGSGMLTAALEAGNL